MRFKILAAAILILLGIVVFSVYSGSSNEDIPDNNDIIQKIEVNNSSFLEFSKDWDGFETVTIDIDKLRKAADNGHEVEYVLKQSDMKALAMIDSFRDVDYLEIINELVPELKTSERGRLKSKSFPYLKSIIYVGQEKHRGMYNTSELILLGSHYPDDELHEIML